MVIINNILHLSVKDLIKFGFKQSQIDKKTSEGIYPSAYAFDPSQPARKELKLIPYMGIPESTRIEKNMPTLEELTKQHLENELQRQCGFSEDAYGYFLSHKNIKDTKSTTRQHQAKAKAEQAYMLNTLARIRTTEVRHLGFADKPSYYTAAIEQLKKTAAARQWPAWKCNGLPGLTRKLKPFQKAAKGKITMQQAWDSLINQRVNNDNALKLDSDQQALLVQMYADPVKATPEEVHRIYLNKAKEMIGHGLWNEKSLISESAVRAFLNKPGITPLWYEARHGYQAYRNVFEPVTERINATFANALWVIDGTPIHNYFQHLDKGKYFRWNIFIVLDAHSHCVLGFWLSETENTEAVIGSLRSACTISGKLPHQVLYDNGSAIQSYRGQHAIQTISVVSFGASAGNARSKVVESYFAWFNQHVQKFRTGFTANPFAKTLDRQPNREALAKQVKEGKLPIAENAVKQLIEDFTIANNTPRPFLNNLSPLQAYRKSIEITSAKQRTFSKEIDIEAFYALPGANKQVRTMIEGKPKMVSTFVPQTYEFTNRGIEITINGTPYSYDIEDAGFRKQFIGQRFEVRYESDRSKWIDERQPAQLLLYLQGTPLQWQGVHAAALPKIKFAMAVADYREGERNNLHAHLERKKEQRTLTLQDRDAMIALTKANKTYTEVSENAFDKEVLQAANSEYLNQIIGGDDYTLDAPKEMPETSGFDRLDYGLDGPTDDTDEDF